MIGNTKFVSSLSAPLNNTTLLSLNENQLNSVNNFFEIVYGNRPCRPYIDLDGELLNYSIYEFEEIDRDIKNILSTIPNVSILTSSKHNCKKFDKKNNQFKYINKLSYRLTWYDEVCSNISECRENIKNVKYPYLKKLLENVINLSDSKTEDGLNIDYMVYRSKGKMRCVNAYKDEYDKERINKLLKGNIQQTIISTNYTNMELLTKVNQNEEIKNEVLEVKTEPVELKNVVVKTKPQKVSKKIKKLQDEIEKEQKKENNHFAMTMKNEIIEMFFINDYLSLIDILKLDYTEWIKMTIAYKKCGGDLNKYRLWNMKSPHYNEKGLSKLWNTYTEDNIEVSMGTIKYYANLHNSKKYQLFKNNFHLFSSLTYELTETNIAKFYYNYNIDNLYSFKNKDNIKLYLFKKNKDENKERWLFINNNTDYLRSDIHNFYNNLLQRFLKILHSYIDELDDDDDKIDELNKTLKEYSQLNTLIGKTSWLNNISKEAVCILKEDAIGRSDIFDKKPYLFAFNNCVFNLKTGEKLKYDKKMMITECVGKDYNDPTPEQFEEIDKIFKSIFPNVDVLKCYLSIMYACLTGIRLERFVIANGSGRNGKGLLNELLQHLMGDYCYKIPVELLTSNVNMIGANPQIANMDKKRMVITSEPEDGCSLHFNTIKKLTGDNTLNARKLYESESIISLLMVLIMEANMKPKIAGRIDNAVASRTLDIPFVNEFTTDDKLVDEANGIYKANLLYKYDTFKDNHYCALFNYILKYADKELYVPDCIVERSKKYVMSSDNFYGWFEENYEKTDEKTDIIKCKELFENYKDSELYSNMTKNIKRNTTYKKFCEQMKLHIILKKSYSDKDTTCNGIKMKGKRLHGWVLKDIEIDDSDSDSE